MARFSLRQIICGFNLLAKCEFPGPGQSVTLVLLLVVLAVVVVVFFGFNVCL